MAKAVDKLSLLSRGGKKSAAPTTDHLPPEDSPDEEQPPPAQAVEGSEPKSGSFEKLNAMFGGQGTRFALPPGARQ